MEIVGIIAEYNPMHNGHIHHIKKIKEMFNNPTIILVLSGNFTQRGDASIINKWDKTKIALSYGVDIVLELPFIFACQSADYFAFGSISILNEMKCTHLVFGSESNDIEKLSKLATLEEESREFKNILKQYLSNGYSYPFALSIALKETTGLTLDKPNDILGMCYIKEILKQKTHIKPITIARTNDFHSDKLEEIASATSIRKAIKDHNEVYDYVPNLTYNKLDNPIFIDDYFNLIKYKIISEIDNLEKFLTIDEGLSGRIKSSILNSFTYKDLIEKVKSKNYTHNKITRALTQILIGVTKEDKVLLSKVDYLRLLGFTKKGQKYLNEIKKEISIPLITKYDPSISDVLKIDFKATLIYSALFSEDMQKKMIKTEFQSMPIIIK
ncbi:MAG: nucleotidyltransferase [Bacilli bacterium]